MQEQLGGGGMPPMPKGLEGVDLNNLDFSQVDKKKKTTTLVTLFDAATSRRRKAF